MDSDDSTTKEMKAEGLGERPERKESWGKTYGILTVVSRLSVVAYLYHRFRHL
jgi:hypothetical protein